MSEQKVHPKAVHDEAGLRRLLAAAGPRPAVPADELAAIKAAAREQWRALVERRAEARRRFGWRPARLLAVAATLIAALALGLWWRGLRTPSSAAVAATVEVASGEVWANGGRLTVGRELVGGARIETAGHDDPTTHLALRLAAGQSVRLATGSRLRLVSDARLELEQGAVYVDSGAGRGSLEVHTGFGSVRDIGTQFEVRIDGGLRVRVRQGSVEIERGAAQHSAVAGEVVTLGADGSLDRQTLAPWDPAWGWVVAAAPPFAGRTLGDYLAWLSRETGWRVRFADEALKQSLGEEVFGLPPHLRPDETVHIMLPATGFEYQLHEGVLVIKP